MCLYTEQKKAKIAIFPKVRYKVLTSIPTEKIYYTPYQGVNVIPSFRRVLKADYFYITSDKGGVIEHRIHTFRTKEAAKYNTREVGFAACIFKVIIPIGTYYFNGEFYDSKDSSCSEKIRFIKEIKTK